MARRSFLLYSTIQVKCPKDWPEEGIEKDVEILQKVLEEHAKQMQGKLQEKVDARLEVKVIH